MMRSALRCLALAGAVLSTGACATVTVESAPAGAEVLIDERPTGRVTPATFSYSELGPDGLHSIQVVKSGRPPSESKSVRTYVSAGRIVTSILFPVPCLLLNLGRMSWKGAEPSRVEFVLPPATTQ